MVRVLIVFVASEKNSKGWVRVTVAAGPSNHLSRLITTVLSYHSLMVQELGKIGVMFLPKGLDSVTWLRSCA